MSLSRQKSLHDGIITIFLHTGPGYRGVNGPADNPPALYSSKALKPCKGNKRGCYSRHRERLKGARRSSFPLAHHFTQCAGKRLATVALNRQGAKQLRSAKLQTEHSIDPPGSSRKSRQAKVSGLKVSLFLNGGRDPVLLPKLSPFNGGYFSPTTFMAGNFN